MSIGDSASSNRETREGVPAVSSAGRILDGRYELLTPIGLGGMGEVWSARHVKLDKRVAIKLLHPAAKSASARLLLEAKLLAALKHEAVIEVFDFGETEAGVPFFAMELVEGMSLADRIVKSGPLSVRETVTIGLALAAGLGAAHAAGVIHRDMKPDNVLLARDVSGGVRPKIVDFGIALARRDGVARLTADGIVVGTPEYMAPEIIRGEEAGPASDVWGLAITLYEALSGVSPFRAGQAISTFRKVLDEPLPFPRDVAGFDGALWRLLTGALRKEPRDRTQTVLEVHDALAAWLASPSARPSSNDVARADTLERRAYDASVSDRSPGSVSKEHEESRPASVRRPLDVDAAPPSLDDMIRRNLGRP